MAEKADHLIQSDAGENTPVGIGRSESPGQHVLAAPERAGVPKWVVTVESRAGNVVSGQLGL